jgi:energy-converting hydrogenase Eha subunit C
MHLVCDELNSVEKRSSLHMYICDVATTLHVNHYRCCGTTFVTASSCTTHAYVHRLLRLNVPSVLLIILIMVVAQCDYIHVIMIAAMYPVATAHEKLTTYDYIVREQKREREKREARSQREVVSSTI